MLTDNVSKTAFQTKPRTKHDLESSGLTCTGHLESKPNSKVIPHQMICSTDSRSLLMPQSSPWANFPHVTSLVWRARRSEGRENVQSLQTDLKSERPAKNEWFPTKLGNICSRLYGGVRIIVCNIRTFTENIRRHLCKFCVRQSNFSGSKAKMCETHSFCVRVGVFVTLGRFPWPLPKSWILAGPIKLHNVTKCNIVIWQSLATSHHTEQWWHHVHLSVTGTWIPTTTTTCVRLYLVYMSHWVSSCTWVTCEIEW